MFNPMMLLQQVQHSQNPMMVLQQMMGNNQQFGFFQKMVGGKNPQQLEQIARNMAKERGFDLEGFMKQMKP